MFLLKTGRYKFYFYNFLVVKLCIKERLKQKKTFSRVEITSTVEKGTCTQMLADVCLVNFKYYYNNKRKI